MAADRLGAVFHEELARLQTQEKEIAEQRDKLEQDRRSLEAEIEEARAKLQLEYAAYQESQQRIYDLNSSRADSDSGEKGILEGNFLLKADDDGTIFIDQDAEVFRYVLASLRVGYPVYPVDGRILPLVQTAYEYLQLDAEPPSSSEPTKRYSLHLAARQDWFLEKQAEDSLRTKLARNSVEFNVIKECENFMLDVFRDVRSFAVRPLPTEFEVLFAPPPRNTGDLCIVESLDVYQAQFDAFTRGLFGPEFDWEGVMVAGGAALAPLLPIPAGLNSRQYYHRYLASRVGGVSPFYASDIDLFLFGLTPQGADAKLEQLAQHFKRKRNGGVVRTKNSVSFFGGFPERVVQVILRIYRSPAEVLIGFDIDVCSVGYLGNRVIATPRARRALSFGVNLTDPSRQSPTYEIRLEKYGKRGFGIAVPGLDRKKVNSRIFSRDPLSLLGLGRLLMLEAKHCNSELATVPHRGASNSTNRPLGWRDEALEVLGSADYAGVVPFGPGISSSIAMQKIESRCILTRCAGRNPTFRVGETLDCVLGEDEDDYKFDLSDEVIWMVENPGTQLTGSFHPMPDRDWYASAY